MSNQLPKGWAETNLREISSKLVDGSHIPPSKTALGKPMLSARNVRDGQIIFDEFRFIDPDAFAVEDKRTNVRPGDVLLTIVGTIGRSAVVLEGTEPFTLQRSVAVLRPIDFSPKLLMYFFQAPQTQKELQHSSRGTAQKGVYLKSLSQIPVRLPPLNEGKHIIAEIEKQFTRLEAGIVALKRVQANLKRYRSAVLKAAVEGRLVPTEAELARRKGRSYEPASELLARMVVTQPLLAVSKKAQAGVPVPPKPKLPEGWIWTTLGQLTRLITSGSRGWAEYYSDSGPLFIRAQDIKTDRLELGSVAHVRLPARIEGARTLVSQEDLLITITGANVTKTAIVHETPGEAYVSQHVALVRPVNSSLSKYMYYWIICPSYGRRELERVAYGAGKPGLNLNNLRELVVAVPPLDEQRRIVAEVERRLSVIDELEMQVEANLKRAERLRQAILKRAFEGKLVPQDPNDEPASMLLERIKAAKAGGDTATAGCAGKRSKSNKAQAGVPVSQK